MSETRKDMWIGIKVLDMTADHSDDNWTFDPNPLSFQEDSFELIRQPLLASEK